MSPFLVLGAEAFTQGGLNVACSEFSHSGTKHLRIQIKNKDYSSLSRKIKIYFYRLQVETSLNKTIAVIYEQSLFHVAVTKSRSYVKLVSKDFVKRF